MRLLHLPGVCVPDSDMDFWATISNRDCAWKPVHARKNTIVSDLFMAILAEYGWGHTGVGVSLSFRGVKADYGIPNQRTLEAVRHMNDFAQ